MNSSTLTLIPYERTLEPVTLGLFETIRKRTAVEDYLQSAKYTFFNCTYYAELSCDDIVNVVDVRVYINDALEECYFKGGRITFPEKNAFF